MKRLLTILLLVVATLQAGAVLKEKDLTHTLGVLKAELKADYEKQKQFMQRYVDMNAAQHAQLISYMKRSEQIGLILYSQKADFTFDMAYACQEATQLFRELTANTIPYDRIRKRVNQEIERYNELIALLKQMPPATGEAKDSLTEVDSLLLSQADSLMAKNVKPLVEPSEETTDPFMLKGEELQDRMDCLFYAEEMLKNMQFFIENVTKEQGYYDQVSERVAKLNAFAQSRYVILQQSIFQDGGSNYFKILFTIGRQWKQAMNDFQNKYRPLGNNETSTSEWRGMYVLFISLFMVIYIAIACVLSNVILRWLLPKRFRTAEFKMKRSLLIYVLGVALFAIMAMVARTFTERNIVLMGTSLMITFAWLVEAILLSLYIRLDATQMKNGIRVYMPFVLMAFVVIVFRIILIPNTLVNLIYPPILLGFTIWQMRTLKKRKTNLPPSDKMYSSISLVAMIVATFASWVGYTLLAVEIMMWWMFQLTAIQTITCAYDMLKLYERRKLIYRIAPQLRNIEEMGLPTEEFLEQVVKRIKKGDFIEKTWVYDFIHRALVPILAVLSILFCVYWAADIFEMTSICVKAFVTNFIELDFVQLSLSKIVLVAGFWFLFGYFNYAIKALYHHIRRRTLGDSKDDYNGTLANNIIAIVVWGGYFIFALTLLRIPASGISMVSAGLAAGMGFAMQSVLENFVYGISLMSGRVRLGDYIECDGIRGRVEKITYQSTMILTMDGCVIAFTNSALFTKNFKNLTRNHQYELVKVPVGVAYGSRVPEVRNMLKEALEPLRAEKTSSGKPIIDENTDISVAFSGFGDNSVDLLVCVWMLVEDSIAISARVKEIIYDTLNENNVNIPFPQRDVYIHKMPSANN